MVCTVHFLSLLQSFTCVYKVCPDFFQNRKHFVKFILFSINFWPIRCYRLIEFVIQAALMVIMDQFTFLLMTAKKEIRSRFLQDVCSLISKKWQPSSVNEIMRRSMISWLLTLSFLNFSSWMTFLQQSSYFLPSKYICTLNIASRNFLGMCLI